jgi:hypothetical protein
MYVQYDERKNYAEKLKAGLAKMPANFTAILCWWCEGTTIHDYDHCSVCGHGKFYGSNNGLLWPDSKPASDSVAYQVLNAAEN